MWWRVAVVSGGSLLPSMRQTQPASAVLICLSVTGTMSRDGRTRRCIVRWGADLLRISLVATDSAGDAADCLPARLYALRE